jgi:uncharacterized protein (DUF58 family)
MSTTLEAPSSRARDGWPIGRLLSRRGWHRGLSGALSRLLAAFTPLGRVAAVVGFVTWFVGWRLGWQEFMLASASCGFVLLFALAFTFGRMNVDVEVEMEPARVVVGDAATGQVTIGNTSTRHLLPLRVELQVGQGVAQFDVPMLAGSAIHTELFTVPTHRRAVIPVGPARSLRGDPLGLLRRSVTWPDVTELYVHPKTVSLDGLGSGFLRDMEGRTTNDTSTSDVELHTLRDYVPGDDRRYVHWRTSARSGKLMVRQFVDTRRSHVALVQSGLATDYAGDDEFETAVSVVASLGIRAVRDRQSVAIVAAGRPLSTASTRTLLDGSSAVSIGTRGSGLGEAATQLLRRNSDVTLALLVTGSATSLRELRAAAARFNPTVKVIALIVDPGATTGFRPVGSMLVMTLNSLSDLQRLVWAVSQS